MQATQSLPFFVMRLLYFCSEIEASFFPNLLQFASLRLVLPVAFQFYCLRPNARCSLRAAAERGNRKWPLFLLNWKSNFVLEKPRWKHPVQNSPTNNCKLILRIWVEFVSVDQALKNSLRFAPEPSWAHRFHQKFLTPVLWDGMKAGIENFGLFLQLRGDLM